MSYTPFPSGAKSPTPGAMFSERMRQLERRTQAALRMLSGQKKLVAKTNLFSSASDLFVTNGCLVGRSDCMGFVPVSDWSSLPIPAAEICECKKISEPLRQHFATYFLDALEKDGLGMGALSIPTRSWVSVSNMSEGHRAVFQFAFYLLVKFNPFGNFEKLSQTAQDVVALAFLMHGPTHALLDWSDFLGGFYKTKPSTQSSALKFLESLEPTKPVLIHFGDYKFRLKTTSRADVNVFDRLITELDNRGCPVFVVGQQDLLEGPSGSLLEVDYRIDAREQFTDLHNKTRFTSTKRKATEAISLLECLPQSAADRFVGLLAEGQRLLANA